MELPVTSFSKLFQRSIVPWVNELTGKKLIHTFHALLTILTSISIPSLSIETSRVAVNDAEMLEEATHVSDSTSSRKSS